MHKFFAAKGQIENRLKEAPRLAVVESPQTVSVADQFFRLDTGARSSKKPVIHRLQNRQCTEVRI